MCTLSYIPISEKEFYFTQNRDESPKRRANGIISRRIDEERLLFPQDIGAGGTWMAASESGRMVAVLNGAFVRHQRQLPYRRSRGLMALDFFAFASAEDFFQSYAFKGMEAFTMIVRDKGDLFDFRWDEKEKHLQSLAADQAHLWASSTLYPKAIQKKRQEWFFDWRTAQQEFNTTNILHFHKTGGDGDPFNDLVMNRHNMVCTTSITMIHYQEGLLNMDYHDLIQQKSQSQSRTLVASDHA